LELGAYAVSFLSLNDMAHHTRDDRRVLLFSSKPVLLAVSAVIEALQKAGITVV